MLPLQGTQIRSLVGELRSSKSCGVNPQHPQKTIGPISKQPASGPGVRTLPHDRSQSLTALTGGRLSGSNHPERSHTVGFHYHDTLDG